MTYSCQFYRNNFTLTYNRLPVRIKNMQIQISIQTIIVAIILIRTISIGPP